MSSLEEDFIYAAEFGDIPTVQRILDENPALNVDFSDILGRTPLRLAVGNEHLEVIIAAHGCIPVWSTKVLSMATASHSMFSSSVVQSVVLIVAVS